MRLSEVDERVLRECCASPEWAARMAALQPFVSRDALLEAADRVLADLPEDEIDRALAGHPRIGERSRNANSAREQATVHEADQPTLDALTRGNAAYEAKFGHVYLVCASGRSAAELLAVLEQRLGNDAATERQVVRTELGKINRLRLERLCPL